MKKQVRIISCRKYVGWNKEEWVKSRGSQIDVFWENHPQVPITASAEWFGLPLCAESCRKSQQSRISRKTSGASAPWAEPEGNHKNNCSLCCVATASPRWKLKMKWVCESVQTLQGFPKPSLWMEKQAHDGGRGSISKLCIVLSSAWLEPTQWLHLFKDIFKHFLQVSDQVSAWNIFRETLELLYTSLEQWIRFFVVAVEWDPAEPEMYKQWGKIGSKRSLKVIYIQGLVEELDWPILTF